MADYYDAEQGALDQVTLTDDRSIAMREITQAIRRNAGRESRILIIRMHPDVNAGWIPNITGAMKELSNAVQEKVQFRCNYHHPTERITLSEQEFDHDVPCRYG